MTLAQCSLEGTVSRVHSQRFTCKDIRYLHLRRTPARQDGKLSNPETGVGRRA